MIKFKRKLPLIVFILAVVLVIFGIFIFRKDSDNGTEEDISNVPTLSESEWPAMSLTPTENSAVPGSMGHWLDFKVEKINVKGAESMDYLLVYNTSDGGQQGVPGMIKLTGSDVERPLLLGSESSGKFRYDAGVETGTMTITFRDSKGKLIGKLTSEFHLQMDGDALTSTDGAFTYTLDEPTDGVYFVTMKTFAEPATDYVAWQNGYGVFSSDGKTHPGQISTK